MNSHHEHQHLQKQQISQKVQQPTIQLSGTQPNIQLTNRQLQECKFLSQPADSQSQQPIFTAGQDHSRRSQLSMLGLRQHQQLRGAGSDRLRMQGNPTALQNVDQNEFVSPQGPQQAPHLLQLHQQMHFQKANDKGYPGLVPQNGMINQQKQLRQSGRVLPEGSSALNDPTPPNQAARFTDWHDQAYQKFECFRNSYSLELDNAYKRVYGLWSQSPESAIKYGGVKKYLESIIKYLGMSSAFFKGLSKEQILNIFNHFMQAKKVLARCKGPASSQHRQQPQPPGSKPELPEHAQQENMKLPNSEDVSSPRIQGQHFMPRSEANKINAGHVTSVASPELKIGVTSLGRQTRHQMVQAQNLNLTIQQTLLDSKKQPMCVQKMYDVNGSKLGQVARTSPGIIRRQVRELSHLNANSPQTLLQSSSQLHQGNLISPLSKAGAVMQTVASDLNVSSTSSPLSTSSLSQNSLKSSSAISPLSAAGSANHPQGTAKDDQIISHTTNKDRALPEENQLANSDESSLQPLLDVVKSISSETLCAVAQDIGSIMNTIDSIGGTTVNCESRAFAYYPRNLLQGGLNGTTYARRMKRHFGVFSAPADVTSSDGLQGLSGQTNYLESTAACRTKMTKYQMNTTLLDEIKEINKRLVETALDLVSDSTENASSTDFDRGTIIRCSYKPVGLGRNMELQNSASGVLPLFCAQLLVPADYPSSCPILLSDSFSGLSEPVEEHDLTKKVNTRFSSSLRELPQPPSLKEMARKWDDCARSVLNEFAVSIGGGSFSTKYGRWENCI